MKKLLSLRHWSSTFKLIYRLMLSPEVQWWEKLMFIIPVAVYWILPDFMPFLPVDDIAFTMIIAQLFASSLSKKYNMNRTK